MVDYQKEKKILEKIAGYFDKMNIGYEFTDVLNEENEKYPVLSTTYTYRDYTFKLHIVNNFDWICTKVLLMDTAKLNPSLIPDVYRLCLELNFRLPETTFSANKGLIFVESDMYKDISFDDFKRELFSIGHGIDALIDELIPVGTSFKDIAETQ